MYEINGNLPTRITDPTFHFGAYVFNDRQMRTRLSRETYAALNRTMLTGEPMDQNLAGEVAAAMKQWALELGATHYTHWFMPMNGTTAEKHESFLELLDHDRVMMDFSAKALTQGEPDASSFPNGGLRGTAKARGYTAWDCTSPAFVKEGTLYIPTAFFSHTGEILDKKSPLLRSVQALNRAGLRMLHLLGRKDVKRLQSTIGPEQEYFLVDQELYNKRPDLVATGRTLFGARPPKGQELEDQYLGSLRPPVKAFMTELNEELWKLGVSAKCQHNEVAPTQHELTVIFDPASVAADNNMLTMELMRRLAKKHGMVCLLHEKPYARVNGSGKHVNWSLSTDTGENVLLPGEDPAHNLPFLMFLVSVIQALDEYGDLLALSVASAANDHRLGGQEAPPAILSMFVGEDLQEMLDSLEAGSEEYQPKIRGTNLGVDTLSYCTVDATDRNRTSPFAFTGNRFEFRMVGSQANVAGPVFSLNAIVSDSLLRLADELEDILRERGESVENPSQLALKKAVYKIVRRVLDGHRKVLFNGDNYSSEWPKEAKRRGLYVLENSVQAFGWLLEEKNIALFEKTGVLSHKEVESRYAILTGNYILQVEVELRTALDMLDHDILPAAWSCISDWAETLARSEKIGIPQSSLRARLEQVSALTEDIAAREADLRQALRQAELEENLTHHARRLCDELLPALSELREQVDRLECCLPREAWPYPSYTDLFFHFPTVE